MENNILFAGDPHGCFDNIIQAVERYKPQAIVVLGDLALQKKLEEYLRPIADLTEIWWIYGNHDVASMTEYTCLFESGFKQNNLHLQVREVAGLKIAGLGGIFMAKNWYPPTRPKWRDHQHWLRTQAAADKQANMPLKLQYSIWHHEYEQMRESLQADILVTHEAPSCHRFGFAAIDELAVAIGAKQIFHGHQHEYYQLQLPQGISVTGVAKAAVVNLIGEQLIATA